MKPTSPHDPARPRAPSAGRAGRPGRAGGPEPDGRGARHRGSGRWALEASARHTGRMPWGCRRRRAPGARCRGVSRRRPRSCRADRRPRRAGASRARGPTARPTRRGCSRPRPRRAWGSRCRTTPTSGSSARGRRATGRSMLRREVRPRRPSAAARGPSGDATRRRRGATCRPRARRRSRARAAAARSTPARPRRPRVSATMTAWSLEPWTKFFVPSTGSTVNAWSAAAYRSMSAGVAGERLLAEHDGVGVGGDEGCRDEHLGLAVGVGDEVAGSLLVDLAGGERPEPRVDDLVGHVLQEAQHLVGLHAPNLASDGAPSAGSRSSGARARRATSRGWREPARPSPAGRAPARAGRRRGRRRGRGALACRGRRRGHGAAGRSGCRPAGRDDLGDPPGDGLLALVAPPAGAAPSCCRRRSRPPWRRRAPRPATARPARRGRGPRPGPSTSAR